MVKFSRMLLVDGGVAFREVRREWTGVRRVVLGVILNLRVKVNCSGRV